MVHRTAPDVRPVEVDPLLLCLVQHARARTAVAGTLTKLGRAQRRTDYDARIAVALQRHHAGRNHRPDPRGAHGRHRSDVRSYAWLYIGQRRADRRDTRAARRVGA